MEQKFVSFPPGPCFVSVLCLCRCPSCCRSKAQQSTAKHSKAKAKQTKAKPPSRIARGAMPCAEVGQSRTKLLWYVDVAGGSQWRRPGRISNQGTGMKSVRVRVRGYAAACSTGCNLAMQMQCLRPDCCLTDGPCVPGRGLSRHPALFVSSGASVESQPKGLGRGGSCWKGPNGKRERTGLDCEGVWWYYCSGEEKQSDGDGWQWSWGRRESSHRWRECAVA